MPPRCSSTSSPPARITWRISSPRVESAPCCASCAPSCTSTARRSLATLSGTGWLETADTSTGSVIRPLADPVQEQGGLVALFGSLAPRGAILKRSAASPELFEHEGRAVVFSSPEDLAARIDDPELDVCADDILVLKNAGPTSPSGMPEAGYLPIPAKLARSGVSDMLRISDARMSGTAFGTVVLHVAPDAASGGPLARGPHRRPHPHQRGGAAPRSPRPRGRAGRAQRGELRAPGSRLRPALPGRGAPGGPRLRSRLPAPDTDATARHPSG